MSPVLMFFISLFISAIFLVFERAVGIGINFHPDSNTYLTRGHLIYNIALENPRFILNHGYYMLSSVYNESANLLVATNMFIYSITNSIFHYSYKKSVYQSSLPIKYSFGHIIVYSLLIFNLYRLHLSVHVLKDTIMIFLVVLMVFLKEKRGFLLIPIIIIFRLFGVMYFILFFKGRTLWIMFFMFFPIALIGGYFEQFFGFLLDWNEKSLNFREGAEVPTFQEYGTAGMLIRMVVWPILMLSGFFLLLSPAVIFVPIAFGSVVLQAWSIIVTRQVTVLLSAFVLMALIAAIVPGFTTYQRYCLPILTVMPILILRMKAGHQHEPRGD